MGDAEWVAKRRASFRHRGARGSPRRPGSVTTTDASFGPARANNQAGRLNVTTLSPGAPSDQTTAYAFGARSFSGWGGANGALVFDSRDALEQLTATELPANFNSNNLDNRSDDKGPEPEATAVGVIDGRTYGFVGFERIGGFVVIDLNNPAAPEIMQYVNNRDFTLPAVGPDSGPEVIDFVPAGQRPLDRPLVVVANEITGAVSNLRPVRGLSFRSLSSSCAGAWPSAGGRVPALGACLLDHQR